MAWTGGFGAVGAAAASFTGAEGFVVVDFVVGARGLVVLAVGMTGFGMTGLGMADGTAWLPFKIPFGSLSTTCSVVTEAGAVDGASAAVGLFAALGVVA